MGLASWRFACVVLLLLPGCAWRYLKATASGAIDCPPDALTIRDRKDGYVIDGCGRTTYCYRAWWLGPDEWNCETGGDIPSITGQGDVVDQGAARGEAAQPVRQVEPPSSEPAQRSAPTDLGGCLDACRADYRACMTKLESGSDASGSEACRYDADMCREACRARFPDAQAVPPPAAP